MELFTSSNKITPFEAIPCVPRHALQKVRPQGKEGNWTRANLEDKMEIPNTLQFMIYEGFMNPNALFQMRVPSRVCGQNSRANF